MMKTLSLFLLALTCAALPSHARIKAPTEIAQPTFTTPAGEQFRIGVRYTKANATQTRWAQTQIYIEALSGKKKTLILQSTPFIAGLETDVQWNYIQRVSQEESGDIIILTGKGKTLRVSQLELQALQ